MWIKLAVMYRMTMLSGSGGLSRMHSMTVTHGKTRMTIMVRTAGLTRLNNTKGKNRLPRMIRLTNHPGKAA